MRLFVTVLAASLIGSLVGVQDAAARLPAAPATTRSGLAAHPGRMHRASITINGADVGPQFQGIGAISGGGGNSRLLIDYPSPQRTQILDYLFKPGYGAALQILKLEIGGDGNSTDGSEPSVEHKPGVVNCGAGYEFWLAKRARSINPAIKLYGLQWSAPGWVSPGSQSIWTAADIRYVITWLNCARSYGLAINYIGGWNEHSDGIGLAGPAWFERLRAALDAHRYRRVQIVAADSVANLTGSDVANDLAADPRFNAAVDILGYHDSCQYPTTGIRCTVPAAATTLGKAIWESEIGRMDANTGAPAMARSINRAYIDARATGLIEWPLLDSMPPHLPMENRGLIWANQPWSGYYHVNLMTWAIAQTTQFAAPGWHYVRGGAGQLDSSGAATYISYEAPDHTAWSLVVQTSMATARQSVRVHIEGHLARSVVRVWSTELRPSAPRRWFVRDANVRPVNGMFSYLLRPGYVYTFTTSAGQRKGHAASPKPKPMPLNYTARPDASNEAWALAAQNGAFSYARDGRTIEQLASQPPVFWQPPDAQAYPYAVVGGSDWANYRISAKLRFTAPGQSGGLISRYSRPHLTEKVVHFYGYQFDVNEYGSWQFVRDQNQASPVTLASGAVAPLGVGTWNTITLAAAGPELTASINSRLVMSVLDSTYGDGLAGISTGGWYQVEFSDLTVREAASPSRPGPAVAARASRREAGPGQASARDQPHPSHPPQQPTLHGFRNHKAPIMTVILTESRTKLPKIVHSGMASARAIASCGPDAIHQYQRQRGWCCPNIG